ncbi:MAG: hypothetical protein QXL09_01320 [Candidatus Aenigmatarchaeota archaeon]
MDTKTKERSYRMSPEEVKELKLVGIRKNFEHHYTNNLLYRMYCELLPKYGIGRNVTPDDIKTYEDLYKIPLIPSDFFKELSRIGKERLLITRGVEASIYFTTSGTTGTQTKYFFDRESLKEINEENVFTCREILEINDNDAVIFLTPPIEKSRTGLIRGGYMMFREIVGDDNIYFLYQEEIEENPSELLENLVGKIRDKCQGRIHLYGPPFVYYEIVEELRKKGKRIEIDGIAMTTGGWKRWVGGEVPKEKLYEGIGERLGIPEKKIRDGLGLTDIFMWCPECEYHEKHVPLGVHVSVRNPEEFTAPVEPREEGLLAFMSPYIKSYPAYVVTGDIGVETVSVDEYCRCGRIGNAVAHKRRAKGTQPRGCALVLEELLKRMENERI